MEAPGSMPSSNCMAWRISAGVGSGHSGSGETAILAMWTWSSSPVISVWVP